ncbi:MAG: hypothetical protein GY772_02520 [bacterium]|nr:hypothetical protein [bacterium]
MGKEKPKRFTKAETVGDTVDNLPDDFDRGSLAPRNANKAYKVSHCAGQSYAFMSKENGRIMKEKIDRNDLIANKDRPIGVAWERLGAGVGDGKHRSVNHEAAPAPPLPPAPRQAESVAPRQAQSVAPRQAQSVAPQQAQSVAPQPELCTVNLLTLGVGNFYDVASSSAAWEMHGIASSQGSRMVEDDLLQDALKEAGEGEIDFFIDARDLYSPAKDMAYHIGLHPGTLQRLATHAKFPALWGKIRKNLKLSVEKARAQGRQELNIVVYCRSGEMRSVGLARLLAHALDHRREGQAPPVALGTVRHLCRSLWKKRTCQGNCYDCRAAHLKLPETVAALIPDLCGEGGRHSPPRGAGSVRTRLQLTPRR